MAEDGGEQLASAAYSRICSPVVGGGCDGGGPRGGSDLHSPLPMTTPPPPLLFIDAGDESQPFNSGVLDIMVAAFE